MNKRQIDTPTCIEDAFTLDIEVACEALKLDRKTLAKKLFKDKTREQAYSSLNKMMNPESSPKLVAETLVQFLKYLSSTENAMRYICHEWGYSMPERIDKKPTAEAVLEVKRQSVYEKIEDALRELLEVRNLERKTGSFEQ